MSDTMFAVQVLLNPGLRDINPERAGWATNNPGYVPPVGDTSDMSRNYVLIHYVRSGCGTLRMGEAVHHVCAGQAFIIMPGQEATYKADMKDPWAYQWVGFTGTLSEYFSALPPVFNVPDDQFLTLRMLHTRISLQSLSEEDDLAYRLASDLLIFYANILKPKHSRVNYVQQILDHVQLFYMQKISVEDLADRFGLDRRYLSRKFKEKIGCTIQQHILNVRLTQGRRFLALGYSVAETSALCGYSSPTIFSKLFKKNYGETPREWTKRLSNEQETSIAQAE